MRWVAALVLVLGLAGPCLAADAPPAGVVEEPVRLPVTIGGKPYALDALVVRRAGDEKLPVALITHGSAEGDPRAANLDWLRGWAHDMANRGWLAVAVMRRGYGASEGEVAVGDGTCTAPDVGRYLDAHADDLEAALRSIAQRPDADMGHVLVVGDSAGGAAALALAARPAAHVTAVVNVSGGLGRRVGPFHPEPACGMYYSDLVWNFARFGTTAHMPTLWLYAENDGWFRPGLVGRMRAAFTGSGGQAELVMLPPFKGDGHTLFFADGGRRLLLPEVDRFLRAHGLPTWDEGEFAPLLARLSAGDRDDVAAYLREPTEKVLAMAPNGSVHWHWGSNQIEDARSQALAYCKRETGAECRIVAEDFSLVDQGGPAAPGQGTGVEPAAGPGR